MKIYLAGTSGMKNRPDLLKKCDYFLESFVSVKPWQMEYFLRAKGFLLDSGAFTFFSKSKGTDWKEYINRYAAFISEYDIKRFFELDIDTLIGYENVLILRKRLEELTGKKSIPVWHKSRGIDEYKKMCDQYEYVAIGGIVTKELQGKDYAMFAPLIREAHRRGAYIHGLGFTATSQFGEIRFDSVDSTTWTMGSRMGNACFLDNGVMRQRKPKNSKPIDAEQLTAFNFEQWVKYQNYAEVKL